MAMEYCIVTANCTDIISTVSELRLAPRTVLCICLVYWLIIYYLWCTAGTMSFYWLVSILCPVSMHSAAIFTGNYAGSVSPISVNGNPKVILFSISVGRCIAYFLYNYNKNDCSVQTRGQAGMNWSLVCMCTDGTMPPIKSTE